MGVASIALPVVLAAFLAYSAARKLSHGEEVVRSYARAGVPEDRLDLLALVLLAGAAGLIGGVFWPALGVAAAIGVTCYFLVAAGFHIRADDARRLPTPLVIASIAALALILRIAAL